MVYPESLLLTKHAPIADPASEGANGMYTDLKCLFANIFATPLYAHPPPKHILGEPVNSFALYTNFSNSLSYIF